MSEYIKKLTRGPIFTVVTYQGYINGYTFYIEQKDKKIMYQNNGVRVDAYDVTGQDKNMHYDQIQEIKYRGRRQEGVVNGSQSKFLDET
jgi:hypothetical protein